MRVMYMKPGENPEMIDVDNTLEALQEKVGGYIETVSICSDVVIICNEEGRIRGMKHNAKILGTEFCGPILIAGTTADDFSDLPQRAEEAFMEYFERTGRLVSWMET